MIITLRWCPRCRAEVLWRKERLPGARASRRSCITCGAITRRVKGRKRVAPTPGLQTYREKDEVAMALWTKLIHRQAPDGQCKRCGKVRPLQAAHCIGRGRRGQTRHDPDNGAPLCAHCHMTIDQDPEEKMRFFRAYLGDARFERLMLRRLVRGKIDLDLVIIDLQRRLAA